MLITHRLKARQNDNIHLQQTGHPQDRRQQDHRTNKFDDTYTGYVNENGYVVTKSRLGLGYLDRAWKEYKNSINL